MLVSEPYVVGLNCKLWIVESHGPPLTCFAWACCRRLAHHAPRVRRTGCTLQLVTAMSRCRWSLSLSRINAPRALLHLYGSESEPHSHRSALQIRRNPCVAGRSRVPARAHSISLYMDRPHSTRGVHDEYPPSRCDSRRPCLSPSGTYSSGAQLVAQSYKIV